jgi:hypothetical protein
MPTLVISRLSCHNFAQPGHKGPNVFIVMDVDGQTARTPTTKGHHRNPAWSEEFKFRIKMPRTCVINFTVIEDGLVSSKTLGSHMTTIGHLVRGQPDTQKVKWKLCQADFCYTLTAKDFGIEAPESPLDAIPRAPLQLTTKWTCLSCGNVNVAESAACFRCGIVQGVATVVRPH